MNKKLSGLLIIVLLATALASCQSTPGELHIYAWSDELPMEVVEDFQKETGIQVTVDTFDSNESLIAKLEAGASGYDLVNPSQYAVPILTDGGQVQAIDHSKLKNYQNISKVFQEVSFDPGNKTSIPYLFGTTGFAYNEECVKEEITSWKALWDPQYAGRIYMLDNMLAAYIAGLQVNGYDANTTDPAEIEKATQSLIEQKAILGGYNFTARYLRHVLPTGLRSIRYYGFCHPAAKASRMRVQLHSGRAVELGHTQSILPEDLTEPGCPPCPRCGHASQWVFTLARWHSERGPPAMPTQLPSSSLAAA